MNLDGLKKLLGQVLGGPVQAGMGMAQGVVKGAGQAMKTPQALGTGGFGRLMQRGMPNTADAASYGIDPTNQRYLNVDPGKEFGYPEDTGQYGNNRVPFGFPVLGGMNKPTFFEDGSYSRDPRGGLNIPRSMPGMQMFEDNSYIDRRY